MSRFRFSAAGTLGLLAVCTVGCHLFGSGPTDQEVVAAVKKSPPSPPTVGPTYLAEVESVEVEERGRYNADGKYWPVRVRVKGGAKIKVTNVLQLGLLGDPTKQPPKAVDFVEEALFAKDDFGNWRVSYNYDPNGPNWRLSTATSGSRDPGGMLLWMDFPVVGRAPGSNPEVVLALQEQWVVRGEVGSARVGVAAMDIQAQGEPWLPRNATRGVAEDRGHGPRPNGGVTERAPLTEVSSPGESIKLTRLHPEAGQQGHSRCGC